MGQRFINSFNRVWLEDKYWCGGFIQYQGGAEKANGFKFRVVLYSTKESYAKSDEVCVCFKRSSSNKMFGCFPIQNLSPKFLSLTSVCVAFALSFSHSKLVTKDKVVITLPG